VSPASASGGASKPKAPIRETSSDLATLLADAKKTGGGGVTQRDLEKAGMSRGDASEVINPGGFR
jgi:hypothetical protein